ncbi:MAG: hypothetical protein ABI690_16735 [Chloroflexota bacterium]
MERMRVLNVEEGRGSTWTIWHSASLLGILAAVFIVELLLPAPLRLWTWLSILALLGIFAVVAGHGVTGLWLGLLIDTRNKVSLSRLQMVLWTILILSGFLAAVITNIDSGQPEPLAIAIPPELWLLMGISTASLVGSPLIVGIKQSRPSSEDEKVRALDQLARQSVDTDKVAIRGQLVVNQHAETARIADLFQGSETGNAGQLDLGKLQMFFFTLVLLFAYGTALAALFKTSGGNIPALPAMDTGMLALLAISHAGYLVNKALPHSESA